MTGSNENSWTDGDIEGVIVRKLKKHCDDRGWLSEIFRSDDTPANFMPVMGYASVTHAGVARGPHAHSEQSDFFAFVFSCSFELRLWDDRAGSATRYHRQRLIIPDDEPTVVVIPPGVVHGYRNASDRDGVVLNFPDRLYAGEERAEPVDEIRYEDSENSLYSMTD